MQIIVFTGCTLIFMQIIQHSSYWLDAFLAILVSPSFPLSLSVSLYAHFFPIHFDRLSDHFFHSIGINSNLIIILYVRLSTCKLRLLLAQLRQHLPHRKRKNDTRTNYEQKKIYRGGEKSKISWFICYLQWHILTLHAKAISQVRHRAYTRWRARKVWRTAH